MHNQTICGGLTRIHGRSQVFCISSFFHTYIPTLARQLLSEISNNGQYRFPGTNSACNTDRANPIWKPVRNVKQKHWFVLKSQGHQPNTPHAYAGSRSNQHLRKAKAAILPFPICLIFVFPFRY